MKNYFFALALMIFGSIAFANTSEVETVDETGILQKVRVNVKVTELESDECEGIEVNWSCGGSTCVLETDMSLLEFIETVLIMDEYYCG